MQHVPQVAAATSCGPLSRCPCFVRWQASFAALRLQHAISQPFSGTTEITATAKGASNDSTARIAVSRKRRMPLSRQNDNITSLQKCGCLGKLQGRATRETGGRWATRVQGVRSRQGSGTAQVGQQCRIRFRRREPGYGADHIQVLWQDGRTLPLELFAALPGECGAIHRRAVHGTVVLPCALAALR